jgi:hypothetical protein
VANLLLTGITVGIVFITLVAGAGFSLFMLVVVNFLLFTLTHLAFRSSG